MDNKTTGKADEQVRACERRLEDLRVHLRAEIARSREPRMQAMFETAAEVLSGLEKAFHDYQEHRETAFNLSLWGHRKAPSELGCLIGYAPCDARAGTEMPARK